MRVVVTGAAGFIGSHLASALTADGHEVVAVDAVDRAAAPTAATANRAWLSGTAGVSVQHCDLAVDDLRQLACADAVLHLAGRPGVRTSWGPGAAAAHRDNVIATRRLLAACAARPPEHRPRVVMASSSSVYGSAERPCAEDEPPRPASPYARSKAAAERLAQRAARAGVPTVILRYFSVYGPRQRPDLAFHRFIEAGLDGRAAPLFGDGSQSRSFTFVDDVVSATIRAATTPLPAGTVLNVGHPATVPVRAALEQIGALLGTAPRTAPADRVPGDLARTWAGTARAARLLDWTAHTDLADGLARQVAWHRARRGAARSDQGVRREHGG